MLGIREAKTSQVAVNTFEETLAKLESPGKDEEGIANCTAVVARENKDYLSILCTEILELIPSHLDFEDPICLALTCRRLHNMYFPSHPVRPDLFYGTSRLPSPRLRDWMGEKYVFVWGLFDYERPRLDG